MLGDIVSLVTACEELSHVASLFWSRYKMNQGICLFHEQVFELTKHGCWFVPSGKHTEPPLCIELVVSNFL